MQQAGLSGPVRCTRCLQRNTNCVKVKAPQSRYCPRPTRTGRRIELGRQLHGSTMHMDDTEDISELDRQLYQQRLELSWPRIYLRLLHCFFSFAFPNVPIPEYERFAHAFNRSFGDPTMLARYLNGQEGDEATCSYFRSTRPDSLLKDPGGRIDATPETVEVMLTVMCAWGAHYILLPFEHVDPECFTHMGHESLVHAAEVDHQLGFRRTAPSGTPCSAVNEENPKKRHKRRQGVACDTCRLRRVRCDLMEQPPGTKSCTRCRVKRIVCTDRYIQWKRERDMVKNSGAGRALPEVQLLPKREEFHIMEELPQSVLNLSQQELLEYGNTREATCNFFVNRALMLVHKYDLVNKPYNQSVTALVLLSTLLDSSRPETSLDAHRVAVQHMKNMYMPTFYDLNQMRQMSSMLEQNKYLSPNRVFLTTYIRDGVMCVARQREPLLPEDWWTMGFYNDDGSKRPLSDSELVSFAESLSAPDSCCMCILLAQRVSSVAHYIYREVIVRSRTSPMPPTMASYRELHERCHCAWDRLFAVETALHVLYAKIGPVLQAMRPFNMVMWAFTVLGMEFLLYQVMLRRINEWASATSMLILRDDREAQEELSNHVRSLMRQSQDYAHKMCRVMVCFIRNLMPTSLLHRGTLMVRVTFRVAQLLSRTPAELEEVEDLCDEDDHDKNCIFGSPDGSRSSMALFLELLNPQPGESPATPPLAHDDMKHTSYVDADACWEDVSAVLRLPLSRQLGPFTRQVRKSDLDCCIEALGRIGFSYPHLGVEIRSIVDTMQSMA